MLDEKNCPGCKEIKPVGAFSKCSRDGLQSKCKECVNAYNATVEVKEATRVRDATRNASPEGRAYKRNNNFMRNYGLTTEAVEALQANGCEICGSMINLHVDHCHVKGKGTHRGCLCQEHNQLLGQIEKHRKFLPKMLDYIDNGGVLSEP